MQRCMTRVLFEGETSKKQNVAARLSSVLGILLEKEQDASSRLCFKCKREMEKLETLSECMRNFREKAQQSLQYQKNLFDSVIQDRTKRCHTSSSSSPIRTKAAQKPPFRPGRRQILKPFNSMNALAEFPCHVGSISAALSCLVYPPREFGEERWLLSRTAAGNRA